MHTIRIDASGWRARDDFYDALLKSLGSPSWHGHDVHPLIDSMITGSINEVEGPYRLEVIGLRDASAMALNELYLAFGWLSHRGAICHLTWEMASLDVPSLGTIS